MDNPLRVLDGDCRAFAIEFRLRSANMGHHHHIHFNPTLLLPLPRPQRRRNNPHLLRARFAHRLHNHPQAQINRQKLYIDSPPIVIFKGLSLA